MLDLLGDDLAEQRGLRAVGDLDVGQSPGQTGIAFEHDDPVTGRTAHELDGTRGKA